MFTDDPSDGLPPGRRFVYSKGVEFNNKIFQLNPPRIEGWKFIPTKIFNFCEAIVAIKANCSILVRLTSSKDTYLSDDNGLIAFPCFPDGYASPQVLVYVPENVDQSSVTFEFFALNYGTDDRIKDNISRFIAADPTCRETNRFYELHAL